ncbi:MAG: pyridoxamine 5'-phosphate oxidase family protein [Roseburia sp.]|nr:pyridoxamine 5'-phosphate oxidase family protein [Roseburia sp.]MCM1278721.1 pyridoxamine 5'-phosphate oxidase family protein [Robinsoniella sp.]
MFRNMRRFKQALSLEENRQILERGTSGVLAVAGDNDYPYAVPLSFVYDAENSRLCFHCAKNGHKLDAIKRNCKSSFCVIDQDQIVPEKYTSYFRSVIVFGKICILEDENQKRHALEQLALKYAPADEEANRQKAILKDYNSVCILALQIEHMTGKEAIELAVHK